MPLVFSTGFAVLEARAEIDDRFLTYVCLSEPFIASIVSRSVGISYPAINPSDLGNIEIALPALEEQRRIASFLDLETSRLDQLDASRQRMEQVLGERIVAARTECVSGFYRHVPMKPVFPIGSVCADWTVQPLKRAVRNVGVGVVVNPSSYFAAEGVPFIHGNNVRDGWFDLANVKKISPLDSRELWRSRLTRGDVVVVRAGYPGRAAVVTEELDGANCASVLIIRCGETLLPEFVEAFFNSALGRAQVDIVRYGAAQEQINVGHVIDFLVPCPPVSEQHSLLSALTATIDDTSRLIRAVRHQRRLLAERRQALITAAVTGEFDVTTARGVGLS